MVKVMNPFLIWHIYSARKELQKQRTNIGFVVVVVSVVAANAPGLSPE